MSFLAKIDDMYQTARETLDVQKENTRFSLFIPVETVGYDASCKFVIKKQEKAKLLLIEGKQRVHISDLQILQTILDMAKDDIEWFLQRFIELYIGKAWQIQFRLDGELFDGYGIEKYPRKRELHLFSDSTIDINDFIFVLNFIFSKDKCWEEMNEQQDFSKRTLCKYIALIDYYANAAPRSKSFLKAVGYPVEKLSPVDDRRTKNLFSRTDMFDISLYR